MKAFKGLRLFAGDGDNLVWHTWKPTPGSPWTPWESLAGFAVDLRATVIPNGGLVLFGLQDGSIYHRWQDQPHGAWSDWTPIDDLPGGSRALEATSLTGGGLVLFALGRVPFQTFGAGVMDMVFAGLFIMAYRMTPSHYDAHGI